MGYVHCSLKLSGSKKNEITLKGKIKDCIENGIDAKIIKGAN